MSKKLLEEMTFKDLAQECDNAEELCYKIVQIPYFLRALIDQDPVIQERILQIATVLKQRQTAEDFPYG